MSDLLLKQHISASFDKAASTYRQAAHIQLEAGWRLLQWLPRYFLPQQKMLIGDMGAGTGHFSAHIAKHFPQAQLFVLDIAPSMLREAKKSESDTKHQQHFICADYDVLPLSLHSLEVIFSNFSLQWSIDLATTLMEFKRVLKPGGLFFFTSLGPASFRELKQSWQAVDEYRHFNALFPVTSIQRELEKHQFRPILLQTDFQERYFLNVRDLLKNLKAIGANFLMHRKHHGLFTPHRLKQLEDAYAPYTSKAGVRVTYELIYGIARSI